jgi:CheY-like chemotaxis protein
VEIDRGQIEQILMNLVVNARDAMPSGGRLQLRTGAVRLEGDFPGGPEGITSGDYLMFSVSDTGTGMSREVLDRVFEPFFTTKERGKGSGLGLATVYGIVTQAGGYTTVYSEPGMGTTLKLYVPASQQEATQEPEKEDRRTSTARGETILLVEDEDVVREPTRRLLEAEGYLVLDTPNPDVALEVAEAHPDIDLLLTDVVMPGMTGKELADRLQADRPNLKVVFVSGYSEDVIVHQGAVDPGVVLIEKPFTRETLLDKVREVLDVR